MVKKTLEKESYLAPQWDLRTVCVERHYLNNGSGNAGDDDTIIDDDNDY